MTKFVTLEKVALKKAILNEKQLQEHIAKDPNVLDLGPSDLKAIGNEKRTPFGRLDLLLHSQKYEEHYVVEIQLGEPDPSHIIRLLEYWDAEILAGDWEYEPYAVLVAENIIGGRHYDVLKLLIQKGIPLIAVNVTAVKQDDGAVGLSFAQVLSPPEETESSSVPQNTPGDWEKKHGENIVTLATKMCEEFGVKPNFTKNYVGMEDPKEGRNARCVIYAKKRDNAIELRVFLPQSEVWDEKIKEQGLPVDYRPKRNSYWFKIGSNADIESHASFFRQMYREALGASDESGETAEGGDAAD